MQHQPRLRVAAPERFHSRIVAVPRPTRASTHDSLSETKTTRSPFALRSFSCASGALQFVPPPPTPPASARWSSRCPAGSAARCTDVLLERQHLRRRVPPQDRRRHQRRDVDAAHRRRRALRDRSPASASSPRRPGRRTPGPSIAGTFAIAISIASCSASRTLAGTAASAARVGDQQLVREAPAPARSPRGRAAAPRSISAMPVVLEHAVTRERVQVHPRHLPRRAAARSSRHSPGRGRARSASGTARPAPRSRRPALNASNCAHERRQRVRASAPGRSGSRRAPRAPASAGFGCTILTMSASDGVLPTDAAKSWSSVRARASAGRSRFGTEPSDLRPTTPDRDDLHEVAQHPRRCRSRGRRRARAAAASRADSTAQQQRRHVLHVARARGRRRRSWRRTPGTSAASVSTVSSCVVGRWRRRWRSGSRSPRTARARASASARRPRRPPRCVASVGGSSCPTQRPEQVLVRHGVVLRSGRDQCSGAMPSRCQDWRQRAVNRVKVRSDNRVQ